MARRVGKFGDVFTFASGNLLAFLPREATRSAVLPWQVVRLSVCPSVTLRYRDHIRWNSGKIISQLLA